MTEANEQGQPLGLASTAELGAWVKTADKLPDFDVPVWLYEDGDAYIGCRVDDSDGWLWAKCYLMPYIDSSTGAWKLVDAEVDDDYMPTLWQPLPDVPRYQQHELDTATAEARQLVADLKLE